MGGGYGLFGVLQRVGGECGECLLCFGEGPAAVGVDAEVGVVAECDAGGADSGDVVGQGLAGFGDFNFGGGCAGEPGDEIWYVVGW